jgi:competence protein ComEC
VGQGDCSLLSTSDGWDILIDAGPKSAGPTLLSFLNAKGISELDVIVISHNHADHLGGLVDLLQSPMIVDQVLYNGLTCTTLICQDVWAEMGKRGITPQAVDAGDTFVWGSLAAAVLNPQAAPTGDENEDSVVVHLDFYQTDLLYTGDIGFSTESGLIDASVLKPVDLLKVAHHGSAYSTSSDFLAAVAPQDSVISVGTGNPYGHPSDETLTRLISSGTKLFRTDLDGDISFTFYSEAPSPNEISVFLPLFLSDADEQPEPTPTPVPPQPPGQMPGENIRCDEYDNVQVCASVSDANPSKYATVTVYGRLVMDGGAVQGEPMASTWHYKTTTSYCNSGVTNSGGIASCERYIGPASVGYGVNIDVMISGYSVTTFFTPVE